MIYDICAKHVDVRGLWVWENNSSGTRRRCCKTRHDEKLDTMVAQLQLFPHFFFSLLILGLSQSCGFQPSSPLSFSPSTTKWPRYSTSQLPSCGSCGGKLTSSAPLMAWPEHDIATRRAPRRYISGLSRQVSWLPSTLSACCMPRIG